MRVEADESEITSQSPLKTTNGSSASTEHEGNGANGTNGTSGETVKSNGIHNGETNGTLARSRNAQSTFFGHDREQVTRILIQGLHDLGYDNAATSLSRESGFDLETPFASSFRIAVMEGDWPEAEALLQQSYSADRKSRLTGRSSSNGTTKQAKEDDQQTEDRLALSENANIDEMLFLIRQQKYLELLEKRDLSTALMVLRQELQPLHHDERQLHALSSLIMCQSTEDLKAQANWDGAVGESRKQLLSDLSIYISPSVMIPEHRLAQLLTQVKEAQVLNCPYHNTLEWPSLYTEHKCNRDDFPLDMVCELDRHQSEVWFLQFSNKGDRLATASKDSMIAIYDTTTFKPLKFLSDHQDPVAYITWSKDDTKLVSCSKDKTARLWDTRSGQCLRILKHHTEPVTTAAWSPDGKSFVTGSLDKYKPLALWPTDPPRSDAPLHNFDTNESRVQDCAIECISPPTSHTFGGVGETHQHEDNQRPVRLVAVCTDQSIQIFDFLQREKISHIQLNNPITCVNISKDGQEMLLNLGCDEVWAMNMEDGVTRQKFRGRKQRQFVIKSCFGGATEGFVISGGEDAKISIWHRHSGRLLEELSGHQSGCVNAVAWNSANPGMFASAGDDWVVRIWSKRAGPNQVQEAQQSPYRRSTSSQNRKQAIPNWTSNR